jgi:polysaccharide biosynthesis transport protein
MMEPKESITNVEEIDFQKYLQVVQRRWLPAMGTFGVVVTAASMYAYSLKPTYKAEGNILINKTSNTSSLTGLGGDIGRLESLSTQGSLAETQAKIVTSVPVLEETIRALDLRDKEGKLLTAKALSSKIKVDLAKGTDAVLQISYTDSNPEKAAELVNKVIDIYIEKNIQENQSEAVVARKFLSRQLPESERSVKQAELNLRRFKEENDILILQQEETNAVNIVAKLEEAITESETELVQVVSQLKNLRNQTREVDSQQAVLSADVSQIKGTQDVLNQLQEAESELRVQRTRFQSVHPTVINLEEKVATLKGLLNERTDQIAGVSGISGQTNTPTNTPRLQIGELRQKLIAELIQTENRYGALNQKIAKLNQAKLSYQQRVKNLPRLEQTNRELERKLKASQSTYETLLVKLQEANIAENQKIGNARIISNAIASSTPDNPKGTMIVAGGAVLGFLLGIIGAFGLDIIDRSLKTVKEARELFQYTLLGIIPTINQKGKNNSPQDSSEYSLPGLAVDANQFPLADAYQMLQANLKFLSSDKQIQAIVVTSSVPKEGKSGVAANLALAMTQVGRKVLLVDADMRNPVQHHLWNLTNTFGLSNMIVDQFSLESGIQEVMPNLFVLPSGVLPPNPVALLDSKRMAALVENFTKDYDFVIFDTPALAGTVDAAVLSNIVDGTLLVVRPGVIEYSSANAAKEFLSQLGQNVLGMVINGVNVKQEPDSYFYYTRDVVEANNVSHSSPMSRTNSLTPIDTHNAYNNGKPRS